MLLSVSFPAAPFTVMVYGPPRAGHVGRITAVGVGGRMADRARFDVRDRDVRAGDRLPSAPVTVPAMPDEVLCANAGAIAIAATRASDSLDKWTRVDRVMCNLIL